MSSSVPGSARVLHVDDDPQLLDLAATLLERERESVTVETATSASEGLDCLDEGTVDCVVSDYDMPGMNGLEFLEAVREEYPDLPFILFTGKGSEEIASEAITAGVTDYLNKGSGTDQYTLLANRIENTVSQYRAERDLQRSTERLRKLYGALTDAIFVLNEDWEFTHLNSQAEEILERTEAELIGENVWEQFEEAVDTTFQEQYEKAMNERVPVEFETFYPPLDVWVEVRAVPTGDGLTAHFRDISEKKEREREIQAQNERLQTIVGNAPVVLFGLDDEGVFTLSEGRGLDQLGVESSSLVGESVFDVYAETGIPEDARRALDGEAVHSTVEVGDRIFESWYRPFENGDGAGSRVIGVAIDSTDRVERERELREGRAFIQSVFDAIPDVLYAFDEERTMLQWNDQLPTVTGYSDAEIADMTPLDFVADEDAATLKQTSAQVFGEGVVATDRVDLVTKAGEHVPSELTAAPITDEDGTIVGLTGTGRDLTERKKRERELEWRTDLLERTQAIANVGGWEFDPVNDELRWTDEVHRIHGVSLDYEPTLEEAIEFYHPEDVPVVEAAVERAIETGESFDEELRLIAADDTQRWVRAQGEPRRVDGETVLLRGVFQDITERIERERRYNAIFDQTFQFTGLMEPDGTLIEANETARRFGGVEPEDVIGEYIWDSYWWEISTEAQERVRKAVPRAAEGEFIRYEEEVKSAEGSAIIDFSVKPVTDEDGEVVLLIPEGRDITEMKEYEERLESRLAAMETSMDGMAILDAEGRYTYVNQAHAAVYGYDDSEAFAGEHWRMCYSEEELQFFEREVMPTLEAEGQWRGEATGRQRDGTEFPQEITLTALDEGGLVCVVRDITERKEREVELQHERNSLAALFENDPDPMYRHSRDGDAVIPEAVNPAFEDVFGYNDATVVGQPITETIVPPDRIDHHADLAAASSAGESLNAEVERLTADGRRTFLLRNAPIEGATGGRAEEYAIYTDITERKEREQELESTRDTLSTLLANIPAGVLAEDASRNVLFANEGFCELFDIDAPPEALVGADCREVAKGVRELFVDSERFMRTNAEYVVEQTAADRETFELVDGRVFERSATPISIEDDENRFLWVYQDITGRVERERAIERERDRFATLFENIPDPSVTVDLETGEAVTRSVNAAFEEVFGYAAETVVGEPLNDLIVPTDRLDEATAIDRNAADGEYVETEVCRQTADGERREFLFRNVPIEQGEGEAFGIYTDVTERREHERYRRRLYDITANAELVTDEIIERALDLGCEYLGIESGFLTHIENDTQRIVRANSPHEALQPGGECPLSEAYCRKTIEMDEPMTVAHAGASGWEGDPAYERFGLEAYVGAKLTVDGKRYGTLCFADRSPREGGFTELERSFMDLTVRSVESTLEHHKHWLELERQNDQLQEFAGVISHDLRNPLTVADGYLELASETGDDEYFTKVGNAHDRMNAIIEDVLTLTRQGERIAETSRVGLAAVAEEAWENVATADAELVIAEDIGDVDADEGRLTQLFENLYRNAMEHAGKDVTVRVGRYSAGFYVEDDGPGIPDGEHERVFESGYTTGEEGTGMGLSIVETIATAHGWGVGGEEGAERRCRIFASRHGGHGWGVGGEEGAEGGARFKVQMGMTRGGSDDLLFSD